LRVSGASARVSAKLYADVAHDQDAGVTDVHAVVFLQVAINVSRVLKAYSSRADLNARMPGFRVQMGFGLHVGWAIEGAIGEAAGGGGHTSSLSQCDTSNKMCHLS
jgi:hypothetical protein